MIALALWWLSWWLPSPAPRPAPGRSPEDVVQTVAGALRRYNSPMPNAGIFTAYCFASPANHAVTGPYSHFLRLVKNPEFAPLLRELPANFGVMQLRGEHAEQILQTGGAEFQFSLTRQSEGPCPGCWMVDGVVRLQSR